MVSKVRIIEKESNNIIAEYPIEFVGYLSKEDYFDEAWENAVDDGLVDEANRSDYDIHFSNEEEELERIN